LSVQPNSPASSSLMGPNGAIAADPSSNAEGRRFDAGPGHQVLAQVTVSLEADFRPASRCVSALASSVGLAHAVGAARRSGSRAGVRRERRRASPPGVGERDGVPVGHTCGQLTATKVSGYGRLAAGGGHQRAQPKRIARILFDTHLKAFWGPTDSHHTESPGGINGRWGLVVSRGRRGPKLVTNPQSLRPLRGRKGARSASSNCRCTHKSRAAATAHCWPVIFLVRKRFRYRPALQRNATQPRNATTNV